MFRRPKPNLAQKSKPKTIPAPVGGLNGINSLADMPPLDAYEMDNLMPGETSVAARLGFDDWGSGITTAVETLTTYDGGSTPKMLAFTNGAIYDVSADAAVGAALTTGRTANVVVTTMFSNAGTQFLLGVNGADTPFSYDGSSYAATTITGLTGSQNLLSYIMGFKGRVFLAQAAQLGFYYLAVGAIQGAATYFDLSQQCQKGGYLMAMASWSIEDSGTGPQDYAVFITSQGEYVVYAGYDPSDANNWTLVGRYVAGKPIGRKCVEDFGGEVVVLTDMGVLTMGAIAQKGGVDKKDALSYKLGKYLGSLIQYATTPGWSITLHTDAGYLVVNAPKGASAANGYVQFVMNTETKNWCRFTGQNALCWTVFNKKIFFGTLASGVFQANTGYLDAGVQVNFSCKQAYNSFDDGFGAGFANKQWHLARLLTSSDGEPSISTSLSVDYVENTPLPSDAIESEEGGEWDVSDWDEAFWGGSEVVRVIEADLTGVGTVASLWVKGYVSGSTFRWFATNYIYAKLRGLLG